jgi:hypothetical protein
MSYYLKYTGIVLLLLSLALPASAQTEKIEIVPKAFLILPEESTVKINGLSSPQKRKKPQVLTRRDRFNFVLTQRINLS